jgi:hypothetical protein
MGCMSLEVNKNGLETTLNRDEVPKHVLSSAPDFRFASLVALGACPLVLYGSFSGTTWMMLLGILLGPLAILLRGAGSAPLPDATRPQDDLSFSRD